MSDFILQNVPSSQATISTSGIAGFFSAYEISGAATEAAASGWNGGFFTLFYLPYAITITQATINVAAVSASATKQFGVAIYPAVAGSSLLASATFDVSTGQATGARNATIAQSSVKLAAGYYYGVTTTNATDVSVAFFNQPAAATLNILNKKGTRGGTVTVSVQGTPDATLGVLTAGTGGAGGVAVFWEP